MAQNVWLSMADGNYGTAANWSLGHVPQAGEDVIIPGGSPSIVSGLNQAGVAIANFFVERGYAGAIGGPATYLSINPSAVAFAGDGLAFINVNAAIIGINVYNTAATFDGQYSAGLHILGSNIASLNVYGGNVGLADFAGQTATVGTVNLTFPVDNPTTTPTLILGSGVTLTNLNQTGGGALLQCAAATVSIVAGQLVVRTSGAITTLNTYGGTVYVDASGTISSLNMRGGATDFSRTSFARTVTTPKIWPVAAIAYDPSVVTFTNPLAPQQGVSLLAGPFGPGTTV